MEQPVTTRNACARGQRGHGRKVVGALAFALIAGAAGGFASKAFAHGPMGGPFGGPGMMFGGGFGHGFGDGQFDPARADARIERMMKHLAVELDATPDQTQRLTAIAKQAARDLAPLRQQGADLRKQAAALFSSTVVDRAALERLRTDQIRIADESSKRMTQAFADSSEVLTPEQRKKLADRMQQAGEKRGRMHRG